MKRLSLILTILLMISGCVRPTPKFETDSTPEPSADIDVENINFSGEEWYDQMEVFAINREPARASFMPYDTAERALTAERSALDELDRTSSPYVQSLNGSWSYYYADKPSARLKHLSGHEADYYWEDWNTDGWDSITIPSSIQTLKNDDGSFRYEPPIYVNLTYPWLNYEAIQYGGQGQPMAPTQFNSVSHYKREFTLNETMRNRNVFVRFDGVESAFYLYINGQRVGYSEDSYTPAEFNITSYLKEGVNTIAVEVYRWSDGSYFENQDFIRLSGIFRDVTLYSKDDVEIRDVFAVSSLQEDGRRAELNIEADLRNLSQQPQSGYSLTVDLLDSASEQSVLNQPVTLNSEQLEVRNSWDQNGTRLNLQLSLDDPQLWSPDKPNLYHLILTLKKPDGTVAEVILQRIGIREIKTEVIDGVSQILLNGSPLLIKGVNRHETDMLTGRALSKEAVITDLTMMKAYNINALRTAHYPNQTLTYDIADEIGLIIVDEANIESHIGEKELGVPGNNPLYTPLILDRTGSMVERDKNHVSVLFWSLGNESTYAEYEMNSDYPFYVTSQWVLHRDPSRLRVYERDNRIGKTRETSMVDVVSSQYWSTEEVAAYAKKNKNAFFQSEYAHAMGNGLGNLKEYFELYRKLPQVQGGFIWDFIDQTIVTRSAETDSEIYGYGGDWGETIHDADFCGNGLVNADRTPSAEMAEVKKVQQDIQFTLGKDGKLTLINEFPATNLSEFDIEVRFTRNGEPFDSYSLTSQQTNVEPLSSAEITIPIPKWNSQNDLILMEVSAAYKEDQNWANVWGGHQGEELAFEQWVLQEKTPDTALNYEGMLDVVQENGRITLSGITADNQPFEIVINASTLQILSYRLKGQTLITEGPLPSFMRAPLSNDPEFSEVLKDQQIVWDKLVISDQTQDAAHPQLTVTGSGVMKASGIEAALKMVFSPSGEVLIEAEMKIPSVKSVKELARVGLQFSLDPSVTEFQLLGRGPEENYPDRNTGTRIGLYTGKIADQFNPQLLKPQDSGNKTEVRELTLSRSDAVGLKLTFSEPLGVNALVYDENCLEQAAHLAACTVSDHVTLHLDIAQRGLGNGSYGPGPLDDYVIKQNQTYSWSMRISPLTSNSPG